jgi:hypothetical protein
MHIDGNKFFISVADPLQLLIVSHLKDETGNSLGEALQSQLEILRECDFTPNMVYVDPASALMSLRGQFPGVVVDPSGAGDRDLDRGSGSPRYIRYVSYRMYRIELLSVPSIRIETVSNFSTSSIRSTCYMRVTLIALGLRTYYVLGAYCLYIHVCM